jgi:translation initiation factor 1
MSKQPPAKIPLAGVLSTGFQAKLRLETGGRAGRVVTLIEDLPKIDLFLSELCTLLKKRCGSGGTYSTKGKSGVVEIQGDRRDQVKAIFAELGYRLRG